MTMANKSSSSSSGSSATSHNHYHHHLGHHHQRHHHQHHSSAAVASSTYSTSGSSSSSSTMIVVDAAILTLQASEQQQQQQQQQQRRQGGDEIMTTLPIPHMLHLPELYPTATTSTSCTPSTTTNPSAIRLFGPSSCTNLVHIIDQVLNLINDDSENDDFLLSPTDESLTTTMTTHRCPNNNTSITASIMSSWDYHPQSPPHNQ